MWTLDFIIRLLSVTIGTVAFAMLFGVRPKHLLPVAFGSAMTMALYALIEFYGFSLFTAAFVSTIVAAVYSEICARVGRAPAIVYLVPCLLPTIPGGSLYRAMSAFLGKNYQSGLEYLLTTLKISIGIAGGIVTVSLLVKIVMSVLDMIRSRREGDEEDAS